MSDEDAGGLPPQPQARRGRSWLPSLIWLLPVLAALVGGAQVLAWIGQKGPTLQVEFATGDGIESGKTQVRYKEVDIGRVTAVALDAATDRVVATIEMAKESAPLATSDARFWVVRPQIGATGISGLGTLFSGPYIAIAPGRSRTPRTRFQGLDRPPAVPPGQKGSEFRLHADSLGSVNIGTPVYYHRLQVGQVASFTLDQAGEGVDLSVFVEAPYTALVGRNTRWWHASGVDLRLDADGLKLDTQSVAALLAGGIAFEAQDGRKPAVAAPAGTAFALADNHAAAMKPSEGPPSTVVMYFDQSLRGLSIGAPVDFRGIVLGQVRAVGVEFDRAHKRFRMPVTVDLYPGRLGQDFIDAYIGDRQGRRDVLAYMVTEGLRAQLRSGNLLTGQLYVAIDFFPGAHADRLILAGERLILPTVPGSLDELQGQVARILHKLDKVPFDDIGANLSRALAQADTLMAQLDHELLPEMKDGLTAARRTFSSAEALLQQDAPLQSDLRRALRDVSDTMQSLRALSDYLERHPEALIRGRKEERK